MGADQTRFVAEADAIECWHFLREDGRLRWGSREAINPGSIVTVYPPLELCYRGLHASPRAIDALQYSPGPIVSRVLVWGEIVRGDDKLCGQFRRCLWMADATNVLHRFACDVATEAMDLMSSMDFDIDPRSRKAIEVKLAWLRGEATDEELNVARDAARAAEMAAAWAGARAAATAAATDAARDAATDAARAAEMAAARAAATAAARAAARAAAMAAARTVAWAVAWDAARAHAWDAARAAQNRRLHDLLVRLKPTEDG